MSAAAATRGPAAVPGPTTAAAGVGAAAGAPSPLELARPDIRELAPYEHAAWNPGLTRLHANESPWRGSADASDAGLNRYPEPQSRVLVAALAQLYGVTPAQVLATRGGDEGIDLLNRAFCRAGVDSIAVCPPTFGMYAVAARIQGAGVIRVPLTLPAFALDEPALLAAVTGTVKLVFLCSPNNPTGNQLGEELVLRLARALAGRALLVVDEAYIEFAGSPSLARHVGTQRNLVVLRTLSKAHALAGARCGALIADPEVVALLRRIVEPYNLTQLSIEAVLRALQPAAVEETRARIAQVRAGREFLAAALADCPGLTRLWPSAANYLLAEFADPAGAFHALCAAGLLVRDVRSQAGLERCLRITVGTPDQNRRLVEALRGAAACAVRP
ncbi:MAG TPA: histidinol-phosphate transaminase [Steroidobacteraceae bacterium]|nr:histidinol-phosphate transaminase [Steroidobacteraceae bacterium]